MNNNLKVGLVLSAGGAKGLTYIGVIKVLEKHNVPIHCITGASAGALIGGVYASGTSIEKIEEVALSVGYRDLAKLIDPIKPSIALIKGNKIIKFLSENLFQERIEDFKIPFACVATDIFTGKKVVFNEGDALTAIRASISAPGIFKPVLYKNMCLVDGGLVDPLPVDVAKDMSANIILAVDVIDIPRLNEKYANNPEKLRVTDTLRASLKIFERRIIDLTLEKVADRNVVMIRPDVSEIRTIDFGSKKNTKNAIRKGVIATERKIDDILRLIE